mmetsp:Transcript_5909/g.14122  ORF Transcript_5909/g.14122 Transcript_5909/m.14122 type:complete len:356 (-) Transcript_5909:42-1109(-)
MAAACYDWRCILAADIGLLANILHHIELQDWTHFEVAAQWTVQVVRESHATLREAVCAQHNNDLGSVWRLCDEGNVTALWALLDAHTLEQSFQIRDRRVTLRHPHTRNSLIHHSIVSAAADRQKALCLSWLASRHGAAAVADSLNIRGKTALHLCAVSDSLEAPCARKLLQLGVPVDPEDNYGVTPLLVAVSQEKEELVDILLRGRADPNTFVPNCHGHADTPLVLAVRSRNASIVRRLLGEPGIDVHQRTMIGCPYGKEAVDFAREGSEIKRLLELAGIAQDHAEAMYDLKASQESGLILTDDANSADDIGDLSTTASSMQLSPADTQKSMGEIPGLLQKVQEKLGKRVSTLCA